MLQTVSVLLSTSSVEQEVAVFQSPKSVTAILTVLMRQMKTQIYVLTEPVP